MSIWQKLHQAFESCGIASQGRPARDRRVPKSRRIALEPLEDRRLLAVGSVDLGALDGANGFRLDGDVTVTNLDDDTAGGTAAPAAVLVTKENGDTAQFTVVLNTEPVADVTVTVASDDETEGRASLAFLVFSPENWSEPQGVTISGVNDDVDDGNMVYRIVTDASSNDPLYDGCDVDDITVTNLDDDTAGITVTPTSDLVTEESGETAQFTVVLNTIPAADVTVTVVSDNDTEGTVSPSFLVFSAENWSESQGVTISGMDDGVDDGDVAYTIVTDAFSDDLLYDGRDVDDVTVTNRDDDEIGVTVEPKMSLWTTEAGGGSLFHVRLDSMPGYPVEIAVSSDNVAEGTVSPSTLVFTPWNWNKSQSVVVIGVDDHMVDGDTPYKIQFAPALSEDPNYSGIDPADQQMTNFDNDTAGVRLRPVVEGVESRFAGQMFDVGEYPDDMTTADFNEDGYADFAVVNRSLGEFSVLLGRGDGTFDDRERHDVGYSASAIASADIDGDGHVDILSGGRLFAGRGDGSFADPSILPLSPHARDIVVEDVDRDGVLDIVYVQIWNTVTLFRGKEDGGFHPYQSFEVGRGVVAVAVSDFDGDGITDLATANAKDDDVSVLLGQGSGAFAPQQRYDVGNYPLSLEAVDLNGDGHVDLVASDLHSSGVSILHGVGDGTFDAAVQYATGVYPHSKLAHDLDGDGDLDLLVADFDEPTLSTLYNQEDGTFVAGDPLPTGDAPIAFALGDLNKDGRQDLGVLCWGARTLAVHLGSSEGGFQFATYQGADPQPDSLAMADFDNDGHLDMVTVEIDTSTSPHSTAVSSWLGRGDGTFSEGSTYDVTVYSQSPVVSDFNEDGYADVVVASGNFGFWTILLGNGDGTFTTTSYETQEQTRSLAVADFNRDGHADLLGLIRDTAGPNLSFSVHLGSGVGTFEFLRSVPLSSTTEATDPSPSALVHDFDSDGQVDVAIGPVDEQVLIFPGVGDGTFGDPLRYDQPISQNTLALGDFNEDGHQDLVAAINARSSGNQVFQLTLLINQGDGTFTSQLLPSLDHWVWDSTTADINQDGHVDLVLVGKGTEILFGRGDGTFSKPVQFAQGFQYNGGAPVLLARDMNEDGWDDLAVTGYAGTVSVLLQNPQAPIQTGEDGTATRLAVTLDSQPAADVKVTVVSSDPTEGTISPVELLFTTEDWNRPKIVTVTGGNDPIDDGDVEYRITTLSTSLDPNYEGVAAIAVAARNQDDDETVDLGQVDFRRVESFTPSDNGGWFRLETVHDGWLTVQSVGEWPADQLTLGLYDPADPETPLAASDAAGVVPRFDYNVETGQVYLLRVTGTASDVTLLLANLINESNGALTVHGTAEGDVFRFDGAASHTVTINGVAYHYEDTEVSTVDFNGGEGRDVVWLYDSAGDETVEAWPDRAVFANETDDGVPDYTVNVTGIEDLQVYATRGGTDAAVFHGSEGADKLKSYEDSVRLRAQDSSYTMRAKKFDTVAGDSGLGGKDLVVFNGSDQDDTFTYLGAENSARVESGRRDHTAIGFGSITVRAGGGENDVARFTDLPDVDDTFYFRSHKAQLISSDVRVTVRSFDRVHAAAGESGLDVARIYDTPGDEHLEVAGNTARLYRRIGDDLDLLYEAVAFERVKCYRTKGDDTKDVKDHSIDLILNGWDE